MIISESRIEGRKLVWTSAYYAATFVCAYVLFKHLPIPTILRPQSSLIGSPVFIILTGVTWTISVVLTLRTNSFLPMYALGVLATAQVVSLYPNYVHANVYSNEGSGLIAILRSGHLTSSSSYLDKTDLAIPGTSTFLSIISIIMGMSWSQYVPLSNLIFIGVWYIVIPLSIQIRLGQLRSRLRYVAYVLFWGLMLNGYVLYEQGLIDHQFATALLAVFLVSISLGKNLPSDIASFVIFGALVISHTLLAFVALAILVLISLSSRDAVASRRLLASCLATFFAWLAFNSIAMGLAGQGVQSVLAIFAGQLSNSFVFHAAVTLPQQGLLGIVASTAMKILLVTVLGLFAWATLNTVYEFATRRRRSVSVSMAGGLATLLVLALFLNSNFVSYGFADRWLWLAPLTLPIALLDSSRFLRPLARFVPIIKASVVIVGVLVAVSFLSIGTALYWHPVAQEASQGSFLAHTGGVSSLNVSPLTPVQYYLYLEHGVDPVLSKSGGSVIIVSPYTQFLASSNSSHPLPDNAQVIYNDGTSMMYQNTK